MPDEKLYETIGEIKGTVTAMRDIQKEQGKDIKKLVSDQNKQNIKIATASSAFGGIAGFMATWIKTHL